MTRGESILSLQHAGVCYGGHWGFGEPFWALKDVSFTLHRGETLGVIGRNGAGKSTLMKLLARVLAPDRGTMVSATDNVQLLSLQVGFNPQLSGRDNAVMSGILLGMRRTAVEAAMDDIIGYAELENFIDQPIRTYSNGMRARLGFAIAHRANPEILLIDEVLGVGDARFRAKSREVIVDKIRTDNTVVIVSHQEATLREYCDRMVWIDEGCSRSEGATEEVLREYRASIQQGAAEAGSA